MPLDAILPKCVTASVPFAFAETGSGVPQSQSGLPQRMWVLVRVRELATVIGAPPTFRVSDEALRCAEFLKASVNADSLILDVHRLGVHCLRLY
jgi:hypothetical protein